MQNTLKYVVVNYYLVKICAQNVRAHARFIAEHSAKIIYLIFEPFPK